MFFEEYELDNIYNDDEAHYVNGYTNQGFITGTADPHSMVGFADESSVWYS